MRKVCAWCQAVLGRVESSNYTDDIITHGICEACATRLSLEMSNSLRDFLDSLGVPILLLESEPRVLTANKHARALLGKDLPEIEGQKGGDLIECVHAKQPGGCGKQIHCKSCVLRQTVLQTFATGESFKQIPAYPDIQLLEEKKAICFLISTEKVGDAVLLRIDDVEEQKEAHAG